MGVTEKHPVLRTRDDYDRAVQRVAELREAGKAAENHDELAALEGAIARYVATPGHPASRRGRPKDTGHTM